MVTVDPKKSIRITADPIEREKSTAELANYFRSKLKEKGNLKEVEL